MQILDTKRQHPSRYLLSTALKRHPLTPQGFAPRQATTDTVTSLPTSARIWFRERVLRGAPALRQRVSESWLLHRPNESTDAYPRPWQCRLTACLHYGSTKGSPRLKSAYPATRVGWLAKRGSGAERTIELRPQQEGHERPCG